MNVHAEPSIEQHEVARLLEETEAFMNRRSTLGTLALSALMVVLAPISFLYAYALLYGADLPQPFRPRRSVGGRRRGKVRLEVWRFGVEGGWVWRDAKRMLLVADVGHGDLLVLRLPRGFRPQLNAPRNIVLYVHEGAIVGWECGPGAVQISYLDCPPPMVAPPDASDWYVRPAGEVGRRMSVYSTLSSRPALSDAGR